MDYVQFGSTEMEVSRYAVGCMSMSGSYGPADDAESIATLQQAFDLGVNFLDTSASYGEGHNHRLIAQALKGRRERVFIHSKSGSPRKKDTDGDRSLGGGSPEYLIKTCEESLTNLGIDTLDVYCMSRIDPNIPVEESVGGMARLVEQGKARYIGLSEASGESIRRARKVHPIVSLQIEFSIFSRDAEQGNLDACREFGMSLMAYAPLGRGLLTGQFHKTEDLPEGDRRRSAPRFSPGNIERNADLLDQIRAIAQEKDATLPQIALAWLMSRGPDVIPIPSSKSRKHLLENIKACDIALTAEDLARIDAIAPYGAPAGTRLREQDMARANV